MSTFHNTVADGRRSGKAPVKSNFSYTCTLLSQFLKEKRISADSNTGMLGKLDPKATTKDLLGNLEQNSEGALRQKVSAMDFLPQLVENPCIKKSNLNRSTGSESPQLTIFYAGKMLVFDAFAAAKATEVMELATKLASETPSTEASPSVAPVVSDKLKQSKASQTNIALEPPRPGNQAVGSDMRYPRRASLLKFLEKRKDRVIARGPYQLNNPLKQGGSSSSGGDPEGSCSKQFDLNL